MIRRSSESGQSTVELALMMPFILGFLILVIDMGLLFFSYVSVTNAVREGARCAAVGGSDAAVTQRVADTSTGLVDVADVNIVERSATVGGDVTIEATYNYTWLFPTGLIPGVDLDSLSFTKGATMRMEASQPFDGSCGP